MKDNIYFGCHEPEVIDIKKKLVELGYDIYDMGDGFDIATHVAVQKFQESRGLTLDGWVGNVTWGKLMSAKKSDTVIIRDRIEVLPKPQIPTTPPPTNVAASPFAKDSYEGKLIAWGAPKIGWTEFSHDAFWSQYWKISGLPSYKTVIGTKHAWCQLAVNAGLQAGGYKGTGRADAISTKSWGKQADDWWFMSPIHIQHPGGGNHATFFLWWVDKSKGLAACMGGNQGNSWNITVYRIAEGYEKCPGGPRWAKDCPPGRVITEAQGRAIFKNAGYALAGSTR